MQLYTFQSATTLVLAALLCLPTELTLARGGFRGGGGGFGGGGFHGGFGGAGGFHGGMGGAGGFRGGDFGGAGGYRGGDFGAAGGYRGGYGGGYRGGEFGGGSFTGPHGGTWDAGRTGIQDHTGPAGGNFYYGGRGGTYTGPGGNTFGRGAAGGVYVGPHGTVAGGGARGGFAEGADGNFAARGERGGIAIGPNGGVAARGASGAVAGYRGNGTYHVNSGYLHTQAGAINNGFFHYDCFRPGWYARYPGAWAAGAWALGGAWTAASWADAAAYCGVAANPVYYDYGSNVVYDDGQVYQNGDPIASQDDYAQQATDLADTGRDAQPPDDDRWQSLGVFALVQGQETTANDLFQLALNNEGVVRGNYYNALTESTMPVYGAVDQKSQRVAWSVGDKKDIVYEAGLANLTQEATPCLVHFGKDKTEQMSLVRVQDKSSSGGDESAAATQSDDAAPQ